MTGMATTQTSLRRTGRAVVVLAASEIVAKIATFLMFMLAARMVGLTEFGVMSFGWSLGVLLLVIPSLGLDTRVIQLGSADPDNLDRYYGAIVVIRMVVAVVVMAATTVVTIALSGWSGDTATVLILVGATLLDPFNDACRSACAVLQRQEGPAIVMVIQRVAALLMTIGGILVTGCPWVGALGYLIACAIGVGCMFVATRRVGAVPALRGVGPEIRLILRAAPVLGLETVSTMGLFRLDSALIAAILGTVAVGLYSTGYRIFETVLFVSWSVSRAFIPIIASRPEDLDHVREWCRRFVFVVAIAYVPYCTVLAVRGDDIVGLLFGSEFVTDGLMLSLAFSPMLFGIAHMASSVLTARKPDPMVVVASLAALALNIGLDFWLLPWIGIVGAGIATTGAFALQAAVLLVGLYRYIGPFVPVRPVLVTVLASIVAGSCAWLIGPLMAALAVSLVTFIATFALVLWVADRRYFDALVVLALRRDHQVAV